jgi:hypothetical protein
LPQQQLFGKYSRSSEENIAVKQLQEDWRKVLQSGAMASGWDLETGEIAWKKSSHLTCGQILRLIKSKQQLLQDTQKIQTSSLCNGMCKVSVDTVLILEALLELMKPSKDLYRLPLMAKIGNKHRLTIAVYANCLLFECMTQKLQTVMAALDTESYKVELPLVAAPSVTQDQPVFESAPYPRGGRESQR